MDRRGRSYAHVQLSDALALDSHLAGLLRDWRSTSSDVTHDSRSHHITRFRPAFFAR
jgi:hypothetical protein